jgi:hypothetical protein
VHHAIIASYDQPQHPLQKRRTPSVISGQSCHVCGVRCLLLQGHTLCLETRSKDSWMDVWFEATQLVLGHGPTAGCGSVWSKATHTIDSMPALYWDEGKPIACFEFFNHSLAVLSPVSARSRQTRLLCVPIDCLCTVRAVVRGTSVFRSSLPSM